MAKKQIGVAAIAVALATVPSIAISQTTVAGFTPGSFRVTESGAAEYRIALQVPPGIAGVQPQLSIVYDSQAGNGLLGHGWALQGLSVISRCPRTVPQDGVRGTVKYDANDRFCLDGQRLMLVSGAYGAAGAVYGTEREQFSKVVSYGTAGNGPEHFKVWTKSGQVLEFGLTADSRIEAQGQASVRLWALNKVTDTKGNYLTVTYLEDAADGNYRPSRIDYAANDAAGVTSRNSVRFTYEARTDTNTAYQGGFGVRTAYRMTKLATYVAETLVKEYRLAYQPGNATGRSRLASVTECAGIACFAPTVFGWAQPASGFTTVAAYALPDVIHSYSQQALPPFRYGEFVDVNNDGLPDWVRAFRNEDGAENKRTWRNTGTGWEPLPAYDLPEVINDYDDTPEGYPAIRRGEFVDVNGDGLADWVRAYRGYTGNDQIRTWLAGRAGSPMRGTTCPTSSPATRTRLTFHQCGEASSWT